MTNPLNNLKQEAQAIRLSSSEKATMRANIFAMADASKRAQTARIKTPSPYLFIFHRRFAVVAAALLLVVFTGGGTAFAAQGALPGTVLYPVKIYVNENVQGALATTPQAKVSFHTAVAETRLKEAETLASEGRLDATTSAQIESNLNDHIAQADTIAATLTANDPAAGVEASVDLDSSLAAQGGILARLGSASADPATQENSNAIAMSVASRGAHDDAGGAVVAMKAAIMAPQAKTMSLSVSADATSGQPAPTEPGGRITVMQAMGASAPAPAVQSTTTQQKIALQLQKKAESELADAHQEFAGAQASLDASTTAKVTAQLADLDQRMQDGLAQATSTDYVSARATFTGVIRDSVALSALIDASKTFKKDFVRAGASGRFANSTDSANAANDSQDATSSATAGVQISLPL